MEQPLLAKLFGTNIPTAHHTANPPNNFTFSSTTAGKNCQHNATQHKTNAFDASLQPALLAATAKRSPSPSYSSNNNKMPRRNSMRVRAMLLQYLFASFCEALHNGRERSRRVRGTVVKAGETYCFLRPFDATEFGTSECLNFYADFRDIKTNTKLTVGETVEFQIERFNNRYLEHHEHAVEVKSVVREYERRYVKEPSQTTKYYEPIFENDQFPKPWSGAVTESGK